MSENTEKMAEVTRKLAREEDPSEREQRGSHDFGAAPADGDDAPAGAGQTDDQHAVAPAAGMARHKTRARD